DYELELRRLLDRQVGWLGAFEDSVDVSRRLPKLTCEARPERQQTAGVRIFPPLEDCRQPVRDGQPGEPFALTEEHRVGPNDYHVGPARSDRQEHGLHLLRIARFKGMKVELRRADRRFELS